MARPANVNFEQLQKQVGKVLRVFPQPITRLAGQPPAPWKRELTLSQVNAGERWIELTSPSGQVVRIWGDGVKGFTHPDILELRLQIVVTSPRDVHFEPILPAGVQSPADTAALSAQDFVARAQRLQQALRSLPQPGSKPRADRLLRQAPLWDAVELEGFRSSANRLDAATAATAARVVTHLRFLEDRVQEVRRTSTLLGYDYNRFPWRMWHLHLVEAEGDLEQLIAAASGR